MSAAAAVAPQVYASFDEFYRAHGKAHYTPVFDTSLEAIMHDEDAREFRILMLLKKSSWGHKNGHRDYAADPDGRPYTQATIARRLVISRQRTSEYIRRLEAKNSIRITDGRIYPIRNPAAEPPAPPSEPAPVRDKGAYLAELFERLRDDYPEQIGTYNSAIARRDEYSQKAREAKAQADAIFLELKNAYQKKKRAELEARHAAEDEEIAKELAMSGQAIIGENRANIVRMLRNSAENCPEMSAETVRGCTPSVSEMSMTPAEPILIHLKEELKDSSSSSVLPTEQEDPDANETTTTTTPAAELEQETAHEPEELSSKGRLAAQGTKADFHTVHDALAEFEPRSVDPSAVRELIKLCQQKSPNARAEEIAAAVREKAPRADTNPTGFCLVAVPPLFEPAELARRRRGTRPTAESPPIVPREKRIQTLEMWLSEFADRPGEPDHPDVPTVREMLARLKAEEHD